MSAVRFEHTNGSVTFSRNPQRPYSEGRHFYAAPDISAGADIFAHDSGVMDVVFVLHWPLMSKADLDALLNFLKNTVKMREEAFTYYDPHGNMHTVRIAEQSFSYEEVSCKRYDVRIKLVKEV